MHAAITVHDLKIQSSLRVVNIHLLWSCLHQILITPLENKGLLFMFVLVLIFATLLKSGNSRTFKIAYKPFVDQQVFQDMEDY